MVVIIRINIKVVKENNQTKKEKSTKILQNTS